MEALFQSISFYADEFINKREGLCGKSLKILQ